MTDAPPARRVISADQRALIVQQLGAALADAWRRQQQQKNERPARVPSATGRDEHGTNPCQSSS